VFIADDDRDDCEMIEAALRRVDATIQIHVFPSGRDMLICLKNTSENDLPQLLILDYNMPHLTGCQVLRQIAGKSRYKDIVKYILSTSGNPQYMDECRDSGADAYYLKPNTFQELTVLAGRMLSPMC